MHKGSLYLVNFDAVDGYRYVTRSQSSQGFTNSAAPVLPGTRFDGGRVPGVALDSDGNPGLAYFVRSNAKAPPESYRVVLVFRRPGQPAPVAAMDSDQHESAATPGAVSLVFEASKPRAAAWMRRFGEGDHYHDTLWFAASDDGNTWSKPVMLPPDGRPNW